MSGKTIELTDVGPIERLTVPLPEGGGITVFRGRNDSGKSLSIGATERLCGGDVRLTQRDGAEEPGSIQGLGMTFRVGQTTRGKGELVAHSIAGKLNIGELIDPGIKDVKAADRARTKALCKLLGVEANPELFRDAIGYTPDIEGDDIVEMQRRLKKRCDEKALDLEQKASHSAGKAAALDGMSDDIDMEAESDAEVIQEQLEAAIRDLARLEQEATEYADRYKVSESARTSLEAEEANYTGPDVSKATLAVRAAEELHVECQTHEDAAERTYKATQQATQDAYVALLEANGAKEGAEYHDQALGGWNDTIDTFVDTVEPSDEGRSNAEACVNRAREAVTAGVKIRERKVRMKEVEQHTKDAIDNRLAAEELRKAGKDTEKVLAQVVDTDSLTMKAGRWMTEHPDRGQVPYHERSRGTRAAMALDLAARRVRETNPDGMVVIPFPQEVWEGLDPDNREKLAAQAKRLNVNLITAECAAGDVRCEVFGENDNEDN